jgi:hypothetical protein
MATPRRSTGESRRLAKANFCEPQAGIVVVPGAAIGSLARHGGPSYLNVNRGAAAFGRPDRRLQRKRSRRRCE